MIVGKLGLGRFWLLGVAVASLLLLSLYLAPGGPTLTRHLPLLDGNRDEGWLLYDALRVARGEVMYRDYFEFKGPTFGYLFGTLFSLAGPSQLAARVLQNLIGVCGAVLVGAVAARFVGRGAAAALALLYPALILPVWPYAYPHWLAAAFVLGGLLLLAREAPRPRDDVVAGALLGMALATIQSLGIPTLAAALGASALPGIAARDLRAAVLRPVRIAAGGALMLGVWFLFFAVQGAAPAFLYDVFVWPFFHYAEGQKDAGGYAAFAGAFMRNHDIAPQPWRALGKSALALVAVLPFCAVAAALATLPAVVRALAGAFPRALAGGFPRSDSPARVPDDASPRFAAVTVAAVALAAVSPMFAGNARNDLTHLAFVAVFGVLGLAVLVDALHAWRPRARPIALALLAAVGAACVLNHGAKTVATWPASRERRSFVDAFLARDVAEVPVLRQIVAGTHTGDPIVVGAPLAGWTYFFTGRPCAVSHTYIPFDPAQDYLTDSMWADLAREIDDRRPKVLWLDGTQWRRIVAKNSELAGRYTRRRGSPLLWLTTQASAPATPTP